MKLHNDLRVEVENLSLGANHGPGAARFFGNAGTEYLNKYGGTVEHFAKIGKDSRPPPLEKFPTLHLKPPRTTNTP